MSENLPKKAEPTEVVRADTEVIPHVEPGFDFERLPAGQSLAVVSNDGIGPPKILLVVGPIVSLTLSQYPYEAPRVAIDAWVDNSGRGSRW